jgi:hypothetical protein
MLLAANPLSLHSLSAFNPSHVNVTTTTFAVTNYQRVAAVNSGRVGTQAETQLVRATRCDGDGGGECRSLQVCRRARAVQEQNKTKIAPNNASTATQHLMLTQVPAAPAQHGIAAAAASLAQEKVQVRRHARPA